MTELRERPGDQPLPTPNQHPVIQDLVIADITGRRELGVQRYGTPLQPFNGRDAYRDAYEEALDLATYLRQLLYEREREDKPASESDLLLERISTADAELSSCQALARVPYEAILAYLDEHGWRPTRGYEVEGIDYFLHPDDRGEQAHTMGTALDRSDFGPEATGCLNAEFVNDLARVHKRPSLAILRELLELAPPGPVPTCGSAGSRPASAGAPVIPLRHRLRMTVRWLGDDGAMRDGEQCEVTTHNEVIQMVTAWSQRTPCEIRIGPATEGTAW